jgi:hypothetical protein
MSDSSANPDTSRDTPIQEGPNDRRRKREPSVEQEVDEKYPRAPPACQPQSPHTQSLYFPHQAENSPTDAELTSTIALIIHDRFEVPVRRNHDGSQETTTPASYGSHMRELIREHAPQETSSPSQDRHKSTSQNATQPRMTHNIFTQLPTEFLPLTWQVFEDSLTDIQSCILMHEGLTRRSQIQPLTDIPELENMWETPSKRLGLVSADLQLMERFEHESKLNWCPGRWANGQEDPTAAETIWEWISQLATHPNDQDQHTDPRHPLYPIIFVGPTSLHGTKEGWMTPHELWSELNSEMHTVSDKLLSTLFTRVMYQRDFSRLIRITFNDSDVQTLARNNGPATTPEADHATFKRRQVYTGLPGGERDHKQ